MKIVSFVKNDPVNSITGFTTTIYVAGCPHHCKGCFSPQTWDYNSGTEYSVEDLYNIFINSPHKNITFLGGDPLNPLYRNETIELIKKIKENTNKKVYVWTGYLKEEVEQWLDISLIDYLIEGKFILEQKDIRLSMRGSHNQRIFNKGIDITKKIDDIR